MAAKTGLPEGAEIISINDQKVKKLNIDQVTNLVRGEEGTKVKLQIKYYKEESTIEIPRAPFTFKEPEYDRFEAHWRQVVPTGIILEPIPHNMQVNMSKKWFNETVPTINYWIARKEKFKSGYDACRTYPESEQNACLAFRTRFI
ncbi:PDZ domain-containing protein [bacterium]|nr:PDZ domain-containing protein [bacterium]